MQSNIKRTRNAFSILLIQMGVLLACASETTEETKQDPVISADQWNAQWIMSSEMPDSANVWYCFAKDWEVDQAPSSALKAKVAVDSKYWLWINDEMVMREGQLKRGPTPHDTYFDVVDIGKYIKQGKNEIRFIVWYFGKEGFTHKNSGSPGLIFETVGGDAPLISDSTWKAWPHPAFETTDGPHPNYRLPESNVRFNAQKGDFGFEQIKIENYPNALQAGVPPTAPWNNLVERLIPHWKDFGMKAYENALAFPFDSKGDTLKMKLPYNAHVNPYLKINAQAGQVIDIRTDHYFGGGPPNLRAEYVTSEGEQQFELPGWINGHEVHYYIPEGIKVLDLQYRETGYDTEFAGSFECDDPFYNKLWEKALRTLYVTMRDNYMDCPDRERAQWWGDVVLESGEAFYALDRRADLLLVKGMYELMGWQREDSTIFSPVPAGNWNGELPTQMLSSVGYYGFWNYYWQTGDIEPIRTVFPQVGKYLSIWKLEENGTVKLRKGGWTWGDWGQDRDMRLLFNTQYYMALDGYRLMAEALGEDQIATSIASDMQAFKDNFNKAFWNGTSYRSPEYQGATDDRSQGLAVVSGLADKDKFEAITKVLKEEMHGSPYMEKYVLEALYQMGQDEFALERMQERFDKMVNHPELTTLWEGWGIGAEGYGGGTVNHAWSGGGLTLLSQYAAGIAPTAPGYTRFNVRPQMGHLKHIKATVPSIKGDIKIEIDRREGYALHLEVPENTTATVYLPKGYDSIDMNDKLLLENGTFQAIEGITFSKDQDGNSIVEIGAGIYDFKAE
ncbi:MAG: alpha-L-rhamnosidase C-terminal domain-containing protein [Bacteroidota bacterium]